MSYQEVDYKTLYKSMKRKLKLLIYENECFQEELQKAQRSLLRVQRDKSFLLDRIMQYQQGPESSSDSEQTDESDNENYIKDNKRRKVAVDQNSSFVMNLQGSAKSSNIKKKKTSTSSSHGSAATASGGGSGVSATKNINLNRHGSKQTTAASSASLPSSGGAKGGATSHKAKALASQTHSSSSSSLQSTNSLALSSVSPTATNHGLVTDNHQMSREEIERQLAARQPITDFSTTVSLTLPNQLFSDNLMEGDLIEHDMETSPSNIGEDMALESFD